MKFGENLQKLRKEKGISQEQLAEQLGVTRQSVSKWESTADGLFYAKAIDLQRTVDCLVAVRQYSGFYRHSALRRRLDYRHFPQAGKRLV